MVIDANDENAKSAGSFFKNPIVGLQEFAEIERRAKSLGVVGEHESVPRFAAGENALKIPAAWLIERSGFAKGFRFGRVGLSSNHTLAIVNYDGAAAQDVLDLKDLIQAKVEEKFGVKLKAEPIFVGFRES